MPKFVKPSVSDSQFVDLLQKMTKMENVAKDFQFSNDQTDIIIGFFGKYFDFNSIYSARGPITKEEKIAICDRFTYGPKVLSIPMGEYGKFITQMRLLTPRPDETTSKMGIRMYIGYDVDPVLAIKRYAVVITPVTSPISTTGILDRENEKELTWFGGTPKAFFALASTSGVGRFTTDYDYCKKLLSNKDSSDVEVVYFMYSDLEDFILKLERGKIPETLQLEFGRTRNGEVTLVLSFLDKTGNIIKSTIPSGGSAESIYFDQGDLMPPPPKDGILRDTFFRR